MLDTRQFNRKVNKTWTRKEAFVLDFVGMLTKINLSGLLFFSKSNQESLRFLLILLERTLKESDLRVCFLKVDYDPERCHTSMSGFEEFFFFVRINNFE